MLTKAYITELKHRKNSDIAFLVSTQHDVGTIVFILESLGQLPADFHADFLYNLLSHNHVQVRLNAVKNIGKLNGKSDTKPLLALYQHETDTGVRREIVSAIGRQRKCANKPLLYEFLNDTDPKIVCQAIRGLLVFENDKEVEEHLRPLVNHENEMVRNVIYKEYFAKEQSKIINIEISDDTPLTHSDIEAKLLLIGSYLNYRTYTPDRGKNSIYGNLGDLCSEKEVPTESIPKISIDKVRKIDVIWFDEEGYPTHAFEVEHSTDVTKGLLRLYQIHKLHIRLYVIAEEDKRVKFNKEVNINPFYKIKEEYIFKNYQELDEFFESVKQFTKIQEKFLKKIVI